MQPPFEYGSQRLTSGIALKIARGTLAGVITPAVASRVQASYNHVKQIAAGEQAVYGINTGFGPLCTTRVSATDLTRLQSNILKSHAVGVGKPLEAEVVKLMIILKIHALAQGYSGIALATLERMQWLVENEVLPLVPSQGSVGASGDLAPLSHLFLPLIGLGMVTFEGKTVEAKEVLAKFGLQPIELSPKEGLALINGTQFIAAHAVKVVERLHTLMMCADITGAMMIEGLKASVKPFTQVLHELRPFPANQYVAGSIRQLLQGSEILASHAGCARVQDPYSLRCIPQVHGASITSWLHLKEAVEIELNSVTDNPVIIDRANTISGGNFHGQPLALPIDYACLAASEIGNISDRRVYLALEGDTPGVPKLLMKETGTNSGFMIVQYTSAALASENKGLCFPASADSIPTSLGQEDHVSMGSIGARKALRVIENTERIVGIELMCAAQAMDYHRPLQSGKIMEAVHAHVRSKIPHIEEDQLMSGFLEAAVEMVRNGELPKIVQSVAAQEQIDFEIPHVSIYEEY
ncbi:histidine ammonia-lyase [Flammeovirgaceae bacterium SG7u.111]|nr:histidine ammonia-lyase [Flammeovirgaceae bacterium SG7u.132]WPO36970.1 histidine ammonia-lyase [Flammeovirgaceae bacterium SG7u.111]